MFAALGYAITKSRGGGNGVSDDKLKIQAARLDAYTANINTAQMRLEYRGCQISQIDYTPPGSWPTSGSFKCYIFHPQGGGAYYDTQLSTGGCLKSQLDALSVGDACGSLIYAGTYGGKRLYTTFTNMGRYKWSSDRTLATGATSTADGLDNTNKIFGLTTSATFPAFSICRALGADWYLPSSSELAVLYANRTTGAMAGTFDNTANSRYWSSSETDAANAKMQQFSTGSTQTYTWKDFASGWFVRCIRQVN